MEQFKNAFEASETDRRKVDKLIDALQLEAQKPMGGDPHVTAWCEATIPELMRGGVLHPHMEEVFAWHRHKRDEFPVVYAHRLALRAMQKQAIHKLPDEYPRVFHNQEAYSYFYHNYFDAVEFSEDMATRKVQTVVVERENAAILTAEFFKHVFGPNIRVLEVGVSSGHAPTMWLLHDKFPIRPPLVYDSVEAGLSNEPNLNYSEKVATILKKPPVPVHVVGADIAPINRDDEPAMEWVKACSFRPKEMLPDEHGNYDPRYLEFDALGDEVAPGLQMLRYPVDIANLESMARAFSEFGTDNMGVAYTPDIIIVSAMVHQLSRVQRARARAIIQRLSGPKTALVVLEFGRPDPSAPGGLSLYSQEDWVEPFNFSFSIKSAKSDEPLKEVGRFRDGRARELALTNYGRQLLEAC